MAVDTKMTKAMWFETLKDVVAASDYENKMEAIEFINKQIDSLNKKKETASKKAAEKKEKGDELRAAVYNILTDELQSIDDILVQVEDEGVTKAKVTARLTQLVKAGSAEKDLVKTEEGRRVTAYKLA